MPNYSRDTCNNHAVPSRRLVFRIKINTLKQSVHSNEAAQMYNGTSLMSYSLHYQDFTDPEINRNTTIVRANKNKFHSMSTPVILCGAVVPLAHVLAWKQRNISGAVTRKKTTRPTIVHLLQSVSVTTNSEISGTVCIDCSSLLLTRPKSTV